MGIWRAAAGSSPGVAARIFSLKLSIDGQTSEPTRKSLRNVATLLPRGMRPKRDPGFVCPSMLIRFPHTNTETY